MLRRVISVITASCLVIIMSVIPSYAATDYGSGNGLRISPVRTDLTITPGKSQTVNIIVENITKYPASLQVIINDFTTTGESGTPALYLNSNKIYNPHSLKQFIGPVKNFTLGPGQETSVPVNINIPSGTPGGGYYGAVRFAPANVSPNSKSVSLTASVASLILVKVPGSALKEQVNLASFQVAQNGQPGGFFFSSGGLNAVARFNNTGNVQEEPFGKVTVTNSSGKVIMTKEINNGTPPGNILPSSIRSFSVPLSGLGSFGKYTVTGNFGYGSTGQLLSASTTIYIVAPWIIALAVIVLVLIIFAIWGMPRVFRAWYRRSIRQGTVRKK